VTLYHPDTDREITRLHAEGHTPEHIADELAIPLTHVHRIAPNPDTRQHILDMWNGGIGKREISAKLLLPLPTIQNVIAAQHTDTRRPPRTTNTSPGTAPLGKIERTLAEAEASPRQRTRALAERARTLITQIRDVIEAEEQERQMRVRVEQAERYLAETRAKLREQQKRR